MTDQLDIFGADIRLAPEQDATGIIDAAPPAAATEADDVIEQLERLAEASSDPQVWRVLDAAVAEIEYLRAAVFAIGRGARPMKCFWDELRHRDRKRQRQREMT